MYNTQIDVIMDSGASMACDRIYSLNNATANVQYDMMQKYQKGLPVSLVYSICVSGNPTDVCNDEYAIGKFNIVQSSIHNHVFMRGVDNRLIVFILPTSSPTNSSAKVSPMIPDATFSPTIELTSEPQLNLGPKIPQQRLRS